MPVPHHSVSTGRMPFLPPNQQRQNAEGKVVSKDVQMKLLSVVYFVAVVNDLLLFVSRCSRAECVQTADVKARMDLRGQFTQR